MIRHSDIECRIRIISTPESPTARPSEAAVLQVVNRELQDFFDPFMIKHGGGGALTSFEKSLVRTYLMAKLLGKFDEEVPNLPN